MLPFVPRHLCAFAVVVCAGPAVADQTYQLDIQPQALGKALQSFATQSGLQVVYYAQIAEGLTARRVVGSLSATDALHQLLQGTELTFQSVNADTIVIRNAAAPASAAPARTSDAAGAGRAESANVQLEEIIVTATKRAESVQDIAMSIAVVGHQDIERRGLIGMEDYLRSIPGVNQIDRGGRDNAVVIRGITTSPEFENASSGTTVATYFDETPVTGAAGRGGGGIDLRPVDLERIEILRGPQGTTFGSAALGGAMRLIPVKPKLDGFGARVAASYSDTSGLGGGNSMLQGVLNVPLIDNELALRAVGYRYDESGTYRNIAGIDPAMIAFAERFGLGDFVRGHVQDDVGRMRTIGGRLAGLWQATDRMSLAMNVLTQTIEQDGSPLAMTGAFEQSRGPIAPQGRVRGEAGELNDTDLDLLNLVLSYDLGWAALTTAASWVDGGSVSTTGAMSALPSLGPSSNAARSDFESFTAETRLVSQLEGRTQMLAGLFYENVDEDYLQHSGDWPGAAAANPFGTDPMFISAIERHLDQRALFGEVSYALTDQLTAAVGGRYFKYDKEESNLQEGGLVRVPLDAGVTQGLDNSDSGSSFKADLRYKPTPDALLYTSWSQGFRLGRPAAGLPSATCDRDGDGIVDGTSTSIASTRQIDSDDIDNYEVGGKFAFFERRLALDVAVYHIEWHGLPIRTVVPLPCNASYTGNAGAATSDGVELQATLFVANGFKLDFGGSYNDAKLSRDAPGLTTPAFEGDRLPGAPRVNANFAAQYDFNVAGHRAFVRADSFYTGEFYGDLLQTPALSAGEYVKVDARAGVAMKNLSLELFVRNLTNEDAFTWRGLATTPAIAYRLRPRTVGVQLGYSFE
jgi:iron complex outermembrane recepter protein